MQSTTTLPRARQLIAQCARAVHQGKAPVDAVLKTTEGRQILALGEQVLPVLIEEIERYPGVCSVALAQITEADPVPHGWERDVKSVIHCWKKWSWGNPRVDRYRAA